MPWYSSSCKQTPDVHLSCNTRHSSGTNPHCVPQRPFFDQEQASRRLPFCCKRESLSRSLGDAVRLKQPGLATRPWWLQMSSTWSHGGSVTLALKRSPSCHLAVLWAPYPAAATAPHRQRRSACPSSRA